MPRKDQASQREYMREWYARNPGKVAGKARERRERYRRRNEALVDQLLEGPCPGCGSEDQIHRAYRRRDLMHHAHVPCSEAKLRVAASLCDVPRRLSP